MSELRSKKGDDYEAYMNKFLKGILGTPNQDCYDIETKTALYEVKGAKLCHSGGRTQKRLSKYLIQAENHECLKKLADEKGKKAKYVFVLKIGNRNIWKTMSYEAVHFAIKTAVRFKTKRDGKDCVYLRVSDLW